MRSEKQLRFGARAVAWSCGHNAEDMLRDCRLCKVNCGCNIVRDGRGFTVRALDTPREVLSKEVA